MCAIFGIMPGNNLDLQDHTLFNRGPDGYGYYVDDNIIMEHYRLEINGKQEQPIITERYVFVMNGELYPSTDSDAMMMFQGYTSLGDEFLNTIDGEYAFALWDKQERKLTLKRDPSGVKPLYIYDDGKHFIFSSNIYAISRVINLELDFQELSNNLRRRFTTEPNTIWKHVTMVHRHPLTENNLNLEYLIKESVENRKSEKGCVALGGIDSGIIAAMSGMDCMSLGVEGEHVVRAYGLNWHICGEYTFDIEDMIQLWEQPFYALSPNYLIARHAAKLGYKVVLTGLGGDELFGGYTYYQDGKWNEAFTLFDNEESITGYKAFEFPDPQTPEEVRNLDMLHYLYSHHVLKSDAMYGRFGVESRAPYLSQRVVSAALRDRPVYPKRILRPIAKRYLPKVVVQAPKKGFRFKANTKEFIEDNLLSLRRSNLIEVPKELDERQKLHLASLNFIHARFCY